MKKKSRLDSHIQRLNIIPLIDVVFMLMAFLLMTFKIGSPEGDFEIKLARGGGGASIVEPVEEQPVEPVHIRLYSDSGGNLSNIRVGDVDLGSSQRQLRKFVVGMLKDVAESRRMQFEAEIEFDRQLRYQFTMDAISAVRGFNVGNRLVPLIEKINVKEHR